MHPFIERMVRQVQQHSPSCLGGFRVSPSHPEPWNDWAGWSLACACGATKGRLLGHPLSECNPDVPLRVHLTDGQTYDIRHPDMVLVLRQRVDIGLQPDPATGVLERVAHCSLLHIVRVEELPPTSPAGTASVGSGAG